MSMTHFAAPADDHGGQQPRFCPHCGHPVDPADTFCQNCGYNLVTDQATAPEQSAVTPPTTPTSTPNQPTPQPRRQRLTKKQKTRWWLGGLVAVILIGLVVWGGQYYSRTATLNRITADIQSGKHLTRDFTTSSTDLKLSASKLAPVNRYYRDHAQALSDLKQQLAAGGRSTDGTFAYRSTGRHWLLFPKYQISVSPVYPTVTTNHAKTVITLDQKTVATATSDSYTKKLGALVPGEYHLQASGKVGGHQLTNSSDYHITSDKTYDLELKTVSVTFNTVPASTITLNGKKIGSADSSGTFTLKNEPWSANMNIQATYSSTAGTAKSNSVLLDKNADGTSVDLNYPGVIDQSDADDFFSNLFSSVQDVANGTDDDDDDALDSFFQNGSSNTEYQQLKSMADGYYKDDDIDYTDMTTTIKDIKPGPNRTSLVAYTVKYDFTLDDYDYDHIQTFQYTATVKDTSRDSSADQNNQIIKISPAQKINDYHDDND